MKFIISKDSTIAVNSAFVKTIYIEDDNASYKDNHTVIRVIAELNRDLNEDYPNYVVNLATFDGGDLKKDYGAAKAYLSELIEKLNGGTK